MTMTNNLEPIPRRVVLKDGRELNDVHCIIICTEYHISIPFLRQCHCDKVPIHQADNTVLVTDSTYIHDLQKDIFHTSNPTHLRRYSFFVANFTLFEFQAIAVVAVLSGKAFLPSIEAMRTKYEQRVRKKGLGRHIIREDIKPG